MSENPAAAGWGYSVPTGGGSFLTKPKEPNVQVHFFYDAALGTPDQTGRFFWASPYVPGQKSIKYSKPVQNGRLTYWLPVKDKEGKLVIFEFGALVRNQLGTELCTANGDVPPTTGVFKVMMRTEKTNTGTGTQWLVKNAEKTNAPGWANDEETAKLVVKTVDPEAAPAAPAQSMPAAAFMPAPQAPAAPVAPQSFVPPAAAPQAAPAAAQGADSTFWD